jgi:DNA-binding protein Fis
MVQHARADVATLDDLPPTFMSAPAAGIGGGTVADVARASVARVVADPGAPGNAYQTLIDEWEAPVLQDILDRFGWNQLRAAEFLGINRATLRARIQKLDLKRP